MSRRTIPAAGQVRSRERQDRYDSDARIINNWLNQLGCNTTTQPSNESIAASTPATTRPASRNPSLTKPQPLVKFIIDQEAVKETFEVHRGVAEAHSGFFKAASTGNFIEGETQTMRLEDVSQSTFGQLVHWLYYQEIDLDDISDQFSYEEIIPSLAKLWSLADRCMIPRLQNDAMRKIANLVDSCVFTEENLYHLKDFLDYTYKDGMGPLKRLALDAIVRKIETEDFSRFCEGRLSVTQIMDVMMVLKRRCDGWRALNFTEDIHSYLVQEY